MYRISPVKPVNYPFPPFLEIISLQNTWDQILPIDVPCIFQQKQTIFSQEVFMCITNFRK